MLGFVFVGGLVGVDVVVFGVDVGVDFCLCGVG